MRRIAAHASTLTSSLLICAGAAGLVTGAPRVLAQDLPASTACHTALKSLADAEDALAAAAGAASSAPAADDTRQRAVTAQLLPLRQRVADACLGGMTASPSPAQRTWVGPLPARPATPAQPPARPLQSGNPVVTVPMPRIDPPVILQHCTGLTCLASDGSTLTRVGPNVVGPRGVCTVVAGSVRCP